MIDLNLLSNRNRDRSTVVAPHGMVCASQPLAAQVGIDVLKAGGSCVDAAVAANAMLGLTEPAMCGIGGDLFAIIWDEAEQQLTGLNASGRTPHEWQLDKARDLGLTSIPQRSPLSWTVPGCVSGWQALLERYGRLSIAQCLEPAIQYALEGFPLSPLISRDFDFDSVRRRYGLDYSDPNLLSLYNPGGKVPGFGEMFRNPELAANYQMIAEAGADGFYHGEIAGRIVASAQGQGGFMTLRDLAEHSVDWVDPVSTNYRGWDVWELPPNGQGITALQMLNMLEQFDIAELTQNSAAHLHLFIEAKKLAYEDRAHYIADPAYADIPLEELLDKDYARRRAALIDPKQARDDFEHGDPFNESDTVYLCAADADGNMISLIQSIFRPWGSGIVPKGLGFAMHNRGQSFALDPAHRNRLEGHKRPFHTIIPAFLTRDDQPTMAFGVMGGPFQPEGHVQVLMNMLDFGMSVQQAGDQPRISHVGGSAPDGSSSAGELIPELGLGEPTLDGLRALGHRIGDRIDAHGGYQAIWREAHPRRYFGGSDPRKDGAALGY
jgi:gamma-glutamyltranspeptidase/glutathione hydrolase